MAKRRCFSSSVIEADQFTLMGARPQILYIHLCMHTDDDGFVDCVETVRKSCGAKKADLTELIEKGYIIQFDNGVIVITDWLSQNTLPKDRYTPTQYKDLYNTLVIEQNTRRYRAGAKVDSAKCSKVEDLTGENVYTTKLNVTKLNITKDNATDGNETEDNATAENETDDNDIIAEYGSYLEEQAKSIFGSSGFTDRKQYQHRKPDIDPISSGDY